MDAFDVFTSKPSITQENDLFEFENTNAITNNQNDDSPNPSTLFQFDNRTSSEVPTASNDELFQNHDQSNKLPPIAEDILSLIMFSNEALSSLQAINKRREEEIAAKDAEENRKIDATRQQAKTDLENWYNERQKQIELKRSAIKNKENDFHTKSFETSSKDSCDWSKVIRLLDFTDGKQLTKSKRDLTRMKSCIFNVKRINEKKKSTNGI